MEQIFVIAGRVEKLENRKLYGWIVEADTDDLDTIVDLYVGDHVVASAHPQKARKDVSDHFEKSAIDIKERNVQFEIDMRDCPFEVVDDVISFLNETLEKKEDPKKFFKIKARRTNKILPSVKDLKISPSELLDLRDFLVTQVQNIADYDPLWARCVGMRRLLERIGLWRGEALSPREMDFFRSDPVGLCVDAKFMDIPLQDGNEALDFYRTMSHRYPVRPNALFDDNWFVSCHSDVNRAVSSGLCLSGLDYFLRPETLEEYLPVSWMKKATDKAFLDVKDVSELLPWVDKSVTKDGPDGLAFLEELSKSGRSGTTLAISEPKYSTQEWVDVLLRHGLFANAAELQTFLGHPVEPDRKGIFDFLGFRQKRTRIILFNTNSKTRNLHITRIIAEDARRLLGEENVLFANQANLVRTCRDNSDAVLLCIDGQRMNLALISRARRFAAATLLWTFDDPYNLKDHVAAQSYFDLIFTNDSNAPEAYGAKGIFLPLAASANQLEADPEPKEYDIFFCGTAWPNRAVLLNRLMADRPEYRYKIALTYNQYVPAIPLDRSLSSYVKTLSYDDFMSYARRSKVTLALHRNFSGTDKLATSSSPGPRMFEVAATGSLQISESAGDDFQALFPENSVDYFDDYQTFLKNVDAALANAETTTREKGERLRKRIAMRHTYMNRISSILTEVGHLQPSAPPAAVKKSRQRLLYVVHNTLKSQSFGGLEIHQDIIKDNLGGDYDFFFFYTQIEGDHRNMILTDSRYKVLENRKLKTKELHGRLEQRDIEKMFSEILNSYDIDGIHFFHFMHNSPSLAHIATAAAVPYVISIHDYYTACRQFNLLDNHGFYCDNSFDKLDDCNICLSQQYNFENHSQVIRRDYYLEALDNANSIIYVSDHTRDKYRDLYPQLDFDNKSRVHGAPIPNSSWRFRRINQTKRLREKNEPAKIVILGNFHENKGARYFVNAISATPDLNIDFHFHGGADERSQKKVKSLLGHRATFHGRYQPGEVDLTQYDFSLHLSNWPETYCQTLSEAWAARLVPIATDIGALGTRVKDGVNGLKCDPRYPASLSRILRQLSEQPDTYLEMRDNISDNLFVTQEEQASMYRDTYGTIFGSPSGAKDRPLAISGYAMAELQRDRRDPRWNHRKVTHPADVIALPSSHYLEEALSIVITAAEISYLSRGCIDKMSVANSPNTPLDAPVLVKNDELVHIQGWVSKPDVLVDLDPIVLVRETHSDDCESVVFKAQADKRGDLAVVLETDDAKRWGIKASIRLLNIKRFLSGDLSLYLGWRDKSSGELFVYRNARTLNLRYGG